MKPINEGELKQVSGGCGPCRAGFVVVRGPAGVGAVRFAAGPGGFAYGYAYRAY